MFKKLGLFLMILCLPLLAWQKTVGDNTLLINHRGYSVKHLKNGVLIAINSPVKIKGFLNGSVFALGKSVIVAGRVNKNIITLRSNVRLKKSALVQGNILSFGGRIIIEQGAAAKGIKLSILKNKSHFSLGFKIFLMYISFIVLGLFYNFFFLNNFIYLGEYIKAKTLKSFFYGLLVLPLAVILTLVLIGTVIGNLFLPALLFIFTFFFFFAFYTVATVLGEQVMKIFTFKDFPYFEQFLGVSTLFCLGLIPIIGIFIFGLFMTIGLGAVLRLRFGVR